jgi:hypothetical protein
VPALPNIALAGSEVAASSALHEEPQLAEVPNRDVLAGENEIKDGRRRLELYRDKKPYRQE